jgi:outer membrane biosynthesis protein TonB
MDIQATNQQSISDDQELAKVLAGITQQADGTPAVPPTPEPVEEPAKPEAPVAQAPVPAPNPTPEPPVAPAPKPSRSTASLEAIKQDALRELRPLVDKLDLPAEEKFDTYLLLLRSTDDTTLIAPAFDSAHNITDEARRAQALLDIIKEIDYLAPQK